MRMPRIVDSLVSYLSPGAASIWKAPALPLKPCQTTSWLDGKAYVSVGQAGGAFHTMLVLQAYQADLLMDLNLGEGLSPGAILEFSCVIDLALRTIKTTACAMGRSIVAMVTMERHLLLNL